LVAKAGSGSSLSKIIAIIEGGTYHLGTTARRTNQWDMPLSSLNSPVYARGRLVAFSMMMPILVDAVRHEGLLGDLGSLES
jgi:hypothetical protein